MTVKDIIHLFHKGLAGTYVTAEISSMVAIIFKSLMNYRMTDLYLNPDQDLPSGIEIQIYNIIDQLKRNRPLQYVLGVTEFYGLPFLVDESVLIPRPETEELVNWILNDYQGKSPRILDIGTGSGCIPVTLKKLLPEASVFAGDISLDALATAKRNAQKNEVDVTFFEMDILSSDALTMGTFDIIVSNPPYVTAGQKDGMAPNVVSYEPHLALFVPQDDPLLFYRAIAQFACKSLNEGGSLYFEINEAMPDETASVIENCGFGVEKRLDINGKYRMLKAKR